MHLLRRVQRLLGRVLRSRWIVPIIWVVLVLIMIAWMLLDRVRDECQSRYNTQVVAAIKERSEAADDRYQAQVDYLKQIDGVPDGDPRRPKLRRAYIDRLAASDARREAAPLPTNPRCG